MVFDQQRQVSVLFGGQDMSNAALNDTWLWDGAHWTQASPLASPSPRYLFGMSYDSNRNVTVLFGGFDGTNPLGETWEWNGSNWANRASPTAPSNRIGHAMAFDAARGVTVLFGGVTINGSTANFLSDTWEWDGTNWKQIFPSDSPSARAVHSMSFDTRRQVVVLFGGSPNSTTSLGDTWEWDGATWSQKTSMLNPSPRLSFGMSYDSTKNVTVLFGGRTTLGATSNNELWEWDGAQWFPRSFLTSPGDREGVAMAFDPNAKATVVFGGNNDHTNTFLDETWQWVSPVPLITQEPADQSVVAGTSAAFSVVALGQDGGPNPPPMTFQWRREGTPLSDGGRVAGSTTSTLTINPAESVDVGLYDCMIHTCAIATSRAAKLDTCKPASAADDCNGNGIADSCDIAADPSLDANNNGVIDSCEPPPSMTTDTGTPALPSAQMAPCGACGAGAATMLPIAMIALGACRRSPRKRWILLSLHDTLAKGRRTSRHLARRSQE